jgi:RNA polymerase sigma factor (sigma-70 family)
MTIMIASSQDLAPASASGFSSGRLRVALASDLSLMAEAVGAALSSRRLAITLLTWPRVPRDDPVHRQLARVEPDVALLIYDVDMSIRMAEAAALIRDWGGPWIVLTTSDPGVMWGGLRAAGASAVRPGMIGLDELENVIRLLADGKESPCAKELDEYVDVWRAAQARFQDVQQRLDSLTPRERQVLDLLRHGLPVRAIASRLGLSESTVRSQVRAVLRKLDVRSQLAAVAVLRGIDELQ